MCISSTEQIHRFGTGKASCFGPVHCLLPSIFMFYVMECTCYCCHGCCSCYPSNYIVVARLASWLPLDYFCPPLYLSLVHRMLLSVHVILSLSHPLRSHLSITLCLFGTKVARNFFPRPREIYYELEDRSKSIISLAASIHFNSYTDCRESVTLKIEI